MNEYLDKYEENLLQKLLIEISSKGYANNQLLSSEDIDDKWDVIVPEYVVDAVPEIPKYPLVAIAWAAYVGMGVAALWDREWESYSDREDIYSIIKNIRGFDCMDEYVREELYDMKPDSKEYEKVEDVMRGCARICLDTIRKEGVEPQSVEAFYIFSRSVKVMYKIGAAVGLKLLKYHYEKVKINENSNQYS